MLEDNDMETITLQYSEAVREKLMNFLETFSNQELKILDDKDERFLAAKAELHADYAASLKPDAVFYSLEEVEDLLENTINETNP